MTSFSSGGSSNHFSNLRSASRNFSGSSSKIRDVFPSSAIRPYQTKIKGYYKWRIGKWNNSRRCRTLPSAYVTVTNTSLILYVSVFACSVISFGLQFWLWFCSYPNLALYKAGDVFTGVKNRESPHDVLLQPVPVLHNFFLCDTWANINNIFRFNSSFRLIICQKQHLANKIVTYHMLLSNIFVNLECGGEYDTEQLLMWSPAQYPEFPQGGL